jgi:cell division protein FtsL
MIRLIVATAFLFSVISVGLVAVKTRVQEMETRLSMLQRDIKDDRDAIRVLKAEWSHLNDPTRLKRLAETYLKLAPVNSTQIASIKALPFRADDATPRLAGQPAPPARPAQPQGAPEVASRRTTP